MADQGSSSASSSSQDVDSSSNSPAATAAARTRSSSAALSAGPKKGRPVRVHTAPPPMPGETPKRAAASPSDRHTSTTARDPMCFSSHTTSRTPASAYAAKACAGCSSNSPPGAVVTGDMVGGR